MIDNETLNETVGQNVQPDVNPEIQTETDETNPVKQPQTSLSEQQQSSSPIENNLRALREKADRIARERDEMARRLQELERRANPVAEEDLTLNLGENDLAEGKHITKLQKQFKRQQDELIRVQKQTQDILVETRLKSEHPDIDKVVTVDNIKSLGELYPEVARTLESSNDYYSKAKAAYTMIKKFGIAQEDLYANERELAQRNAAKPRPLASVSPQQAESPLSRANAFAGGLTDDLKKQLLKEMEESARSY